MAVKLSKRFGEKQPIPKRVRIAADGLKGTVTMVYYDRQHTGDSFDELHVTLDNGQHVKGSAEFFESIDDEAFADLNVYDIVAL